ncbi:MAG: RbsD/FucU family protein [Planctomycetota bacterium]
MITGTLIHPELLGLLATAGHGSKILISDFNYSHGPRCGPNGTVVYANFAPGVLGSPQVLEIIASVIPIESAAVMEPMEEGPYAMTSDPPVWAEFRRILGAQGFECELERIERFAFYDAASDDDHCLTIATGETGYYASILLTIGAIPPPA